MESPIRTCLGCGARKAQPGLIRFVKSVQAEPFIGRLLPGRGYYVCPDFKCVAGLERRSRRWFDEGERGRLVGALRAYLEENRSAQNGS